MEYRDLRFNIYPGQTPVLESSNPSSRNPMELTPKQVKQVLNDPKRAMRVLWDYSPALAGKE
jgi:hypothetical protein